MFPYGRVIFCGVVTLIRKLKGKKKGSAREV
jgi:hypothetical protein